MSRALNTTLAAALSNGNIMPVILVQLGFKSGTAYVWSGVGDLVYGGNTFKGVGSLGNIAPISEGSSVKADGTVVTLSGLALTTLQPPALPTGVTPPVTVSAGQFVAWSYPGAVVATSNAYGSTEANLSSAGLAYTFSSPFSSPVTVTWSAFQLPPLPADAVIQAIYPVVVASASSSQAGYGGPVVFPTGGVFGPAQYSGGSMGVTEAAVTGASLEFSMSATLAIGPIDATLTISFVGLAIYYTSVQGGVALLNEAIADVQPGGAAQIWFGLMASGALLGAPYLVFSGLIDQPTVKVSADIVNFALALENRLVNLQRANQRRYTAADQHLYYPDDIGFNWVEILNDEALRWG